MKPQPTNHQPTRTTTSPTTQYIVKTPDADISPEVLRAREIYRGAQRDIIKSGLASLDTLVQLLGL